ncbi:MAG: Outer membrane protein assembly factor BamD [Alphaproteobacteria bacterium MarineAlpha9_Bin3]|nr:MAG: Outer membrane protein assembly factor BamD [Alphaproteobacteria bacterium MarineAlpha9_Bin3]|tara:strand:+ start:2297 stop:3148 length:852 start_codon:yes stop_codon:yes gene_type:complete
MINPFSILLKFLLFILLFLTISCSSNTAKKKEEKAAERSVEEIYNSAMDYIDDNKFITAHGEFLEVERLHPYSIWATRSQIMTAYVNYKLDKYDDSVTGAKRYIELHPGASDIDYAFYLIALNYYEQINDYRRDQSYTEKALEAFNNLIRRFPNSDYAKDARLKLDLVNDHLAAKEMDVGRTYQNLDNYISAINRFKTVVDLYSKTSHVPEALARLTEMYYKIGLYEEAKVYASVLGYNYPENKWYLYSYSLFQKEKEILKDNKEEKNSYINILNEFLDIFGN